MDPAARRPVVEAIDTADQRLAENPRRPLTS
jgi:hypothetical protein